MEKKNSYFLALAALVIAVVALVAVFYNSKPSLSPVPIRAFKITNTDPSLNCLQICTQRSATCIGSGRFSLTNIYYNVAGSSQGSCTGSPLQQILADSDLINNPPGQLGYADECSATGSAAIYPGTCVITNAQLGAIGLAMQKQEGSVYCDCISG